MTFPKRSWPWWGGAIALLALGVVVFVLTLPVSETGRYRGYSKAVYDKWVRLSRYVAVRDGTKLAVDIYRPSRRGEPVVEALPVLWMLERYHRADSRGGKPVGSVDRLARLQRFLRHGYVIGIADVRGSGASFGTCPGPFPRQESLDSYDITEWFASQPWCDGNVGMFGQSYAGTAQYFAAAAAPPHLKAIFAEFAMFDLYSFAYPGGMFRHDFGNEWSAIVDSLDRIDVAAPVDSEEALLEDAVREHRANRSARDLLSPLLYRDGTDPGTGEAVYDTRSPSSCVDAINRSGIAVYHMGGWFDMWPKDALLCFANLTVPQKIIIGPWPHSGPAGFNRYAEQLRWFDYWLKGIDNGIMSEPPIHYFVMGAPEGHQWRATQEWPIPQESPVRFYLCRGSGDAAAGRLCASATTRDGADEYRIDYTTTSGSATRWTNGYGGAFGYPDMSANDAKALTYTTDPMAAPLEVTGHPVAHVWVTCTTDDVDVVAYLEEVDAGGVSHYITEGCLRASHRSLSTPSFDCLGLPYHSGLSGDVEKLPGEPVELVFDLLPTSNVFDAGHRVRFVLAGSDRDNLQVQRSSPPPLLTVHRSPPHESFVTLPVIPASRK